MPRQALSPVTTKWTPLGFVIAVLESDLDINATQAHTLTSLMTYADIDNGQAYPSMAQLSKRARQSPNTLRTNIDRLEKLRLVEVVPWRNEWGRETSYVFILDPAVNSGKVIDRRGQPAVTRLVSRGSTVEGGGVQDLKGAPSEVEPERVQGTSTEKIAVLRTGTSTSGRRSKRVDPRAAEDAAAIDDYSDLFAEPEVEEPDAAKRKTNNQYAAGMAKRFASKAVDTGLVQHTNQDALRRAIRGWLDNGVDREVVKAMIDRFFDGQQFTESQKPLWKQFLGVAPQLQSQLSSTRAAERRSAKRTGQVHRPVVSLETHRAAR